MSNTAQHHALQAVHAVLKADPTYLPNTAVLSQFGWKHKDGGNILCVSTQNGTSSGYGGLQLGLVSTVGRVLGGRTEVEALGNWRAAYERMENAKFVVWVEKPDGTIFSPDWEAGITNGNKMQDAITETKTNRNWLTQDRSGAMMRFTQNVFEKKEGFNPAAWTVDAEVQPRFNQLCEANHVRPVCVYDVLGNPVHPHRLKAALVGSIVKISYLVRHYEMRKQAYDSFTANIHHIDILVAGAPDRIAGPQRGLAPAFTHNGASTPYASMAAPNGNYTPGHNGYGSPPNNSSHSIHSGYGHPHFAEQNAQLQYGALQNYGAANGPLYGGANGAQYGTPYGAAAGYAPYDAHGGVNPNPTSGLEAAGASQDNTLRLQDAQAAGAAAGATDTQPLRRVPGDEQGEHDAVRKIASPTPTLSTPSPSSPDPRSSYAPVRPPSTPPRQGAGHLGGFPFTPPKSYGWSPAYGSPHTPHGFYNGVPSSPTPPPPIRGNWPYPPHNGKTTQTPQMQGDWPHGPPHAWLTGKGGELGDARYQWTMSDEANMHASGYSGPPAAFPGDFGGSLGRGMSRPPSTQPIMRVGAVLPVVPYGKEGQMPYLRPGEEPGAVEPDVHKVISVRRPQSALSSSVGEGLSTKVPPSTPMTQQGASSSASVGQEKASGAVAVSAQAASVTPKRAHDGEERVGDDNGKKAKTAAST
ncbi:hypothetical protein C8R43DRAFT_1121056 [Mycena crocata]|nr:hypothetical protein C8R43DRAFT_1121056 [Mycena crocata]